MSKTYEKTNTQVAQKSRINSLTKNKQFYPTIGSMLWWTIRDVEITPEELESRITNTLGMNFMPNSPSTGKAIKRGIESLESTGIITRIPSDDSNIVAFTLHRKDIDRKNVDLDLLKNNTIIFNKSKNTIEVKDSYRKQEIIDMIEKYSTIYTDSDLRLIILDYLHKNHAITMRDTGGIYFTNSKELEDNLRKFIVLNGGSFYALGVPDSPKDKNTMSSIIKNEIESEIQIAAKDLQKHLSKNEKKRTGVLEIRIKNLKAMQEKTLLYNSLLKANSKELTLQVESVTKKASKALTEELNAFPQAEKFPLRAKVEYMGNCVSKYGKFGVIVGYTYNLGLPYLRVKFEKIKKVIVIAPGKLTVIK